MATHGSVKRCSKMHLYIGFGEICTIRSVSPVRIRYYNKAFCNLEYPSLIEVKTY
jgi:hypothetical protein